MVDHYAVVRKVSKNILHLFDPWFGDDHKYTITKFRRIWKTNRRFESEKGRFIAIKR